MGLAESVGLSPRYFHKVFKEKVGVTPRGFGRLVEGEGLGGGKEVEEEAGGGGFIEEEFDFSDLVHVEMMSGVGSSQRPADSVPSLQDAELNGDYADVFGHAVKPNKRDLDFGASPDEDLGLPDLDAFGFNGLDHAWLTMDWNNMITDPLAAFSSN
jgi:hypothetical protein